MNHPCAHQPFIRMNPYQMAFAYVNPHLAAMAIMANQLDFHHCSLLRKRVQHREEALMQFLEGDFVPDQRWNAFWLTNIAFKCVGPLKSDQVKGPLGQGGFINRKRSLLGFHPGFHPSTSSTHPPVTAGSPGTVGPGPEERACRSGGSS